ncbi:hypothetical protein LJC49_01100 [Ruminococcaceae bacterium OttesenSCG-928-I18]|nr:hypothetical protein [Ruminococcaceae bacterium OttesenSCG-928-I18]
MNTEKGIIRKAAQVGLKQVDEKDLAKINQMALRTLTAEEVFVFKLAMCDNEIDRTHEAFTAKTLTQLAALYVGRTIIADHERSTHNQCARIFDTEVISAAGQTGIGETYSQLVAHCYMLRNPGTEAMIADIEGGIKKEVSVGCRIGAAVCSVCGTDNVKTWCDHIPGKDYDGEKCHFLLEGAKDAYEVSFVAVPAQPRAGVIKAYGAQPPAGTDEPDPETEKNEELAERQLELNLAAAFLSSTDV